MKFRAEVEYQLRATFEFEAQSLEEAKKKMADAAPDHDKCRCTNVYFDGPEEV